MATVFKYARCPADLGQTYGADANRILRNASKLIDALPAGATLADLADAIAAAEPTLSERAGRLAETIAIGFATAPRWSRGPGSGSSDPGAEVITIPAPAAVRRQRRALALLGY